MLTDLFLKMLNREASSPERGAEWIIASLRISEGQTVADIGAGGGHFTLEFARRVGKSGRVFAVDDKRKYLDFIRRQSERAGLENIEFILAASGGVGLPASSVDLIFARNVFHHLPEPAGPERGCSFVSMFRHFTPAEKVRGAMETAGYVLSESFDFLPKQSFMVFSRSGDEKGKIPSSQKG